ncbi:MAG: translation initiation factor IF-3 [Candidatus Omnitrophota bacterium]
MLDIKEARVNYRIRIRQVRLIGSDSEQLGVVATEEAIKRAQDEGLDLVEVAPLAKPPVCRIMDYSKYKYEQSKREREAKKKQHVVHVKELKMTPNIDEHDLAVKLNSLRKFLSRGDKAKITMKFRGREKQHMDRGRAVLDKLMQDVADVGSADSQPRVMFGRSMIVSFSPKAK